MPFIRDAVAVFTTSAATLPFGLVASILLARWLSVADRGAYALASELALSAVILTQFGWPQASIHRIRAGAVRPDSALGAALLAWIGLSAAGVLACIGFRDILLSRVFVGTSRELFAVAVATIPFQLLGLFLGGIARGIDRFDLFNAYRLLLAILTVSALATALLILESGAVGALLSQLAVHVVLSLGMVMMVVRSAGLRLPRELAEMLRSLRFGVKTHLQSILANIHERIDLFMLSYLLQDATAVAFYAVAVGVVNRLRLIPDSIAISLFPTLSGLRDEDASRFSAGVARNTVFWMLLMCLAAAPVSPLFFPLLFGAAYAESVGSFLLLLPSVMGLGLYYVIARYFTSRDRQFTNVGIQLIATTTNVLLNWFWIPRWGIVGAAGATLASYTLAAVLAVVALTWSTGLRPQTILLLRVEDYDRYRSQFHRLRGRFRESLRRL